MKSIPLYHYWRSSCSWRVRWGLKIKKVPYEDRIINLLNNEQKSSEFLKVNPVGYVPAIELDGQGFGESLAILEWLEETYPTPALLPQNSQDRLFVRQISHAIISGIQPLQNLVVLKHISPDASVQATFAKHWIEYGLTKIEKILNHAGAGTFCFGGSPTMADLCLVPQAFNAGRYGLSLDSFPTIKRITETCLKTPECDAAAPHNQPGAQA